MKNQKLITRMKNAFAGIRHAWRGERSFRAQVGMGLAAVIFFVWWGLPPLWWGLIIIAVALVLAAELVNSGIEALADHLHPAQHPAIGKVKDMAAGMVLVMAIAAVVIGLLAILSNPGS